MLRYQSSKQAQWCWLRGKRSWHCCARGRVHVHGHRPQPAQRIHRVVQPSAHHPPTGVFWLCRTQMKTISTASTHASAVVCCCTITARSALHTPPTAGLSTEYKNVLQALPYFDRLDHASMMCHSRLERSWCGAGNGVASSMASMASMASMDMEGPAGPRGPQPRGPQLR